jgi:hypothetical protein
MKTSADTERDLTPAELVRIHEANCAIDFPTQDERNFRIAWMKLLARRVNLKELSTAQIVGPGGGGSKPKSG